MIIFTVENLNKVRESINAHVSKNLYCIILLRELNTPPDIDIQEESMILGECPNMDELFMQKIRSAKFRRCKF